MRTREPAVSSVSLALATREALVSCIRLFYGSHRSSGFKPVCFAIRASIRGPTSSPWWKANTKSGEPDRDKTRCEPVCRLVTHPIRASAASIR